MGVPQGLVGVDFWCLGGVFWGALGVWGHYPKGLGEGGNFWVALGAGASSAPWTWAGGVGEYFGVPPPHRAARKRTQLTAR